MDAKLHVWIIVKEDVSEVVREAQRVLPALIVLRHVVEVQQMPLVQTVLTLVLAPVITHVPTVLQYHRTRYLLPLGI